MPHPVFGDGELHRPPAVPEMPGFWRDIARRWVSKIRDRFDGDPLPFFHSLLLCLEEPGECTAALEQDILHELPLPDCCHACHGLAGLALQRRENRRACLLAIRKQIRLALERARKEDG